MKYLICCDSYCLDEPGLFDSVFKGLEFISPHDPVAVLQQSIIAAEGYKDPVLITEPISPSTGWVMQARELIAERAQEKTWLWSDRSNVWLLDFWKHVNPGARFILTYARPEVAVAEYLMLRALGEPITAVMISMAIGNWESQCRQMLTFFQNNREHALLVSSDMARRNPSTLVDLCENQFNLKLSLEAPAGELSTQQAGAPQSLPRAIAGFALLNESTVETLYDELEAAATLPSILDGENHALDARIACLAIDAWEEGTQLAFLKNDVKSAQAEKDLLAARLTEQDKLIADLQPQLEKVIQEKEAHAKAAAEKQQQLQTVTQEKEAHAKAAAEKQQQLQTVTQEKEANAKALAEKQQQLQTVTQEKEAHAKALAEKQQQLQTVTQEKEANANALAEKQQQLQTVTQEKEANANALAEKQQQLQKVTQEKDAHAKAVSEKQQELVAVQGNFKSTREQLQEISAENEMLLRQLHQVQEELEHYLIKYQELDEEREKQTNKLVFGGGIGRCSADRLEGLSILYEDGVRKSTWRIFGLRTKTQYLDSLYFSLLMIDGLPALELTPDLKGAGSDYIQWASLTDKTKRGEADNEPYLLFMPSPSADYRSSQQDMLRDLSAEGLRLIYSLVNAMPELLMANQVSFSEEFCAEFIREWKLVALQLQRLTAYCPPQLILNSVELIDQVQIDDHEQLWLGLKDLEFFDRELSYFECRVDATHLTTDTEFFANNFALTFREMRNGQIPLQAWPPIYEDEYGHYLTVRVAVNEGAMVLSDNEVLSFDDMVLIKQLFAVMPSVIARLHQAGEESETGWEQWRSLSQAAADIVENTVVAHAETDTPSVVVKLGQAARKPDDGRIIVPISYAAISGVSNIGSKSSPLKMDSVELIEQTTIENHEQLWFGLNHFAFSGRDFYCFDVRLDATYLSEDDDLFANYFALTFREMRDGQPPLQSWPPSSEDVNGYYLSVNVAVHKGQVVIANDEKLSSDDASLINSVFAIMPELMKEFGKSNYPLQRGWEQWRRLVQAAASIVARVGIE